MQGYLGETPIDISDTVYSEYTPKDWALFYIKKYGGIDGAHHKDWVLDQVVRLLTGAVPKFSLRKWANGQEELTFDESEMTTPEYEAFVLEYEDRDENGEVQYEYNTGIAP